MSTFSRGIAIQPRYISFWKSYYGKSGNEEAVEKNRVCSTVSSGEAGIRTLDAVADKYKSICAVERRRKNESFAKIAHEMNVRRPFAEHGTMHIGIKFKMPRGKENRLAEAIIGTL